MKTIPVSVYRTPSFGDFTNGGMSAKYDTAYLICDKGWRETPNDDPALLRIVYRAVGGVAYMHTEPVAPVPEGNVGPMFGGNFIYTSDSRFPHPYPIPIHDRYETYELYELLSR